MATLNSTKVNGTLRSTSLLTITGDSGYTDNYSEGIRVHASPTNKVATIMLCSIDNTGDTGTSANTWGLFNVNGDMYFTRNGGNGYASSLSTNTSLSNVGGTWIFDGMVDINRYTSSKLTTNDLLTSNTAAIFGGHRSKTNISTSVTSDYNSIVTLVAGDGGATNGSTIGFHNPNTSSATFGYVNTSDSQGYFKLLSDDSKYALYVGSGNIKLNRKSNQWDAGQDGIYAEDSAVWIGSSNRQFGFTYAGTDGYIFRYSQTNTTRYIDLPTSDGLMPVLGEGKWNYVYGDGFFNINNSKSSSTSYNVHGIQIQAPNASNSQAFIDFGHSLTKLNEGHIDFTYVADGSTQNYVSLGLHSADSIMKIYGNGTTVLRHLTSGQSFTSDGFWDQGLYIQDSAADNYSCIVLGTTTKSDALALIHNGSLHKYYFDTRVSGGSTYQIHVPTGVTGGMCVVTGYSNGVLSLNSTV